MTDRPSTAAVRAGEAALMQAWPDLAADPVYVNQLVQHALDAALPVDLAAERERIALRLEAMRDLPNQPQWDGTPHIEETLTVAAAVARAGGEQ